MTLNKEEIEKLSREIKQRARGRTKLKLQLMKLIEEYEHKIKYAEMQEEETCYRSKTLDGGYQYWLGIRVALTQVIQDLKEVLQNDRAD